MSETIKVRINSDGLTATEVNEMLSETEFYIKYSNSRKTYKDYVKSWQEAEDNLRTFEIDFNHLNELFEAIQAKTGGVISHTRIGYDPGTIRNAEILDNDKLIIIIL